VVALRVVENSGHADRDHPRSDLCRSCRTAGGLHLYRRRQGRSVHDDSRPRDRRLHLREIGKRTPVLRNIGAAAIFATFVPSALVYYKLLPLQIEKSIIEFTKYTNFLYLFIACIIVGSILSMDRRVLVKGFLKIFVPLAVGSIVAGIVGTLVGTLLGLGAYHTFFFVVVPIMAGGVGEGAIPLSVGYSEILGQPQGDVFAQVLPPVMLGSLTAILLAGTLNFVGKRYPQLTGEGRLQPGEHDDMDTARDDTEAKKARRSTSALSLPPAWQRLRSIS
jgi:Na+/citrate symporter